MENSHRAEEMALRAGADGRKREGIAPPVSSQWVSVEEYLATEPFSLERREYLAGLIYGMAGASEEHHTIAMNLYRMLGTQLRGRVCQPFGSEMKLRLRRQAGFYFYYPDAMISCDPTDSPSRPWKERPTALFEILSTSTRSNDEREKRMAHLELPSLQAYVRIEQERPDVAVDGRNADGDWQLGRFAGLDAVATLPALKMELPLAELYERLGFAG